MTVPRTLIKMRAGVCWGSLSQRAVLALAVVFAPTESTHFIYPEGGENWMAGKLAVTEGPLSLNTAMAAPPRALPPRAALRPRDNPILGRHKNCGFRMHFLVPPRPFPSPSWVRFPLPIGFPLYSVAA